MVLRPKKWPTCVSANPTDPVFCADPAIFMAFQKRNKNISYLPTLTFFRKLDMTLTELTRQFLCCSWPEHGPTLIHQRSVTEEEIGERGGSVVECRTPEREVRGSRPTAAVLCPWARHFTPRKYWLITQEAMAPSRHDWKIVDWDVKPQHNQQRRKKSTWPNQDSNQRHAYCASTLTTKLLSHMVDLWQKHGYWAQWLALLASIVRA